ncbi:MAG: type III pantothenate kinase [bacterium]
MRKKSAAQLLAIDIGNTNATVGLFRGDRLARRWEVASDVRRTPDEYAIVLRNLLCEPPGPKLVPTACFISSVVPPLSVAWDKAVRKTTGLGAMHLTSELDLGLRNLYENPAEVGADRLANAVGGKFLFGAPLVIVDFGTATTFDFVSPKGDYLGGIIMPGMEMSAEALFRGTSKLPLVSIEKPQSVIGRTTIQSMRSGLFHGFIAAIDGLLEKSFSELGEKWQAVATGGLGELIAPESRYLKTAEPNLTLIGMREIWKRNRR